MADGEGSVFGRYLLVKRIASGGMGEIYLGKLRGPLGFEKLLVIKRILRQHTENAEFFEMFLGEARLTAQLSHANVVQIFEMGQVEDSHYIAMEYVHGKSLHRVLKQARARGEYTHPAHVVEIMEGVCRGMEYAHHAKNMSGEAIGVIHRDLNPYNVLVSYAGEVKVIDFGIAKSALSVHKTQTGAVKGKLVYMSPEQSASEAIDHRSDIFSIGICAYEALTFENPFSKDSLVLSLDAIQHQEPAPLAQTSVKLAAFDPVVSKALAKTPSDRYAECTEFSRALEAALEESGIGDAPHTLASYMHDLFSDEIDEEQRAILGTDPSGSSRIHLMQEGLQREEQLGSDVTYRLKTPEPTIIQPGLPATDDSTTPARPAIPAAPGSSSPLAAQDPAAVPATPGAPTSTSQPSRWPIILSALLVLTLVSVLAVVLVRRVLDRSRSPSTTTVVEIAAPAAPAVTGTSGEPNRVAIQHEVAPRDETAEEGHQASPQDESQVEDEGVASPLDAPGSKRRRRPDRPSKRKTAARRAAARPAEDETTRAARSPRFGDIRVSTFPPVMLSYDNVAVGQTFRLKAATGDLVVGSGTDSRSDPFVVHIRYTVRDGNIEYAVDSKPWAIVKNGSGIGLGRTPLLAQRGSQKTVFELINPKDKLTQRITLLYKRRQ